MRITNGMMVSRMMLNMNNNLRNMDKEQNDLSTGVKIHRPSDDPVLVARSLKIHTDIAENEQFTRNVDDAYSWLDKTETSLKELNNVLQRVRELSVQAANGVLNAEDTQKIQSEVEQLKEHMVKIGNDTYIGRHIFSGFKTDEKYLNDDGTVSLKDIGGQKIEYQVGVSAKTTVNVTGEQVFGTLVDVVDESGNAVVDGDGNPIKKNEMFKTMDDLIGAMKNGDSSKVSNLLGDLDKNIENLLQVRGEVGAKMNTVEVIKDRAEEMTLNFTSLLSKTEDTDMGEAVMKLNILESVYKASLSIGARVIQPTLVDFLR
ncbi:flagellar hook-associated protein 3 [Peptoclostridium acidaminophilum DSM 3953]|uniref:Flagellar hook-associated protein 3 n=1 Tax=Peptoclostridium acidaminophilum DSM 3953 TaxID=1286171 RepID=W8T493_PEPAC|nr:flagellar hook-associated protein FlgL [Peptoclostridium acidaminophilum]AHM55620.1 flagellar hook-associated protein 3 [Peptoclostridium acidaminophilum DSM 3953]